MGISTHVLDTSRGKPAAGVPVTLERRAGDDWHLVSRGSTDADGRVKTLQGESTIEAGVYRIRFDTAAYFAGSPAFYPEVSIAFEIADAAEHYHVPLLISPYGYSTYRGS